MKPRFHRSLPRTLVICFAPLLACASAHAGVVSTNESNGNGVWTLPAGTNLLTGTAPATAAATHEGSSSNWLTVVDGTLGDTGGSAATSVTPNNGNTVTFPLDLTSKPEGYNITSFDSYCTWGNKDRDNQTYMLQYSTVANPGTFITISTVSFGTGNADRSTHTRLTDNTGVLASGVHSIRLIFDRQENGYVGYREFVLQDTPTVVCVDNAVKDDLAWSPFTGPNLLNGTTASPATAATHEGSSNSWTKLTDGALGTTAADVTGIGQSVTPNNNDTVTFPLDTVAKPTGYDITSFECYAAWANNGRDDQRYTLEYATVADPGTFLPITAVNNHTEFPLTSNRKATRTRVTTNTGAPLALGVAAIRVTFQDQENTYTGFREMILRDTPLPSTIVRESNATAIWTLPAGTNLLANSLEKTPAFADGSFHSPTDITNSDWTTLTDGSLGSAGTQLHSVGPNNNTSVIFPLDISTNTNGYKLKSLDTYGAWGDSGRDDQDYTVSYSTVEAPGTFIPIETISNKTYAPYNATHTRIASTPGYLLATRVSAIKFDFANQENGWTGFREFIALGSPVALVNPLTWAGLDGSGGNATWIAGTDNNWKDGVTTVPFNNAAELIFDNTGINTNISIPAALTASSLTFANDDTHPYAFSGNMLTVTNSLEKTGSGNVVFGNSLQAAGLAVAGTGSLTLSAANTLTGSSTVNNGTLNLGNDGSLGTSLLTLTGGTVNFTSPAPVAGSIAGTGGAIILGNPAGAGIDTALTVGFFDTTTSSTFAGSIGDASATANGSLVKAGTGTLTLSGTNTYSGTTTVNDGELKLGKRVSLYGGITGNWTASNIIVFTDLTLQMGGSGEFTGSDVAAFTLLGTGGFDTNAILGLDTSSGNAEISDIVSGGVSIEKEGINTLKLSGANTFTNGITVTQGALELANPTGISIQSDLTVGNVTFNCFANMGASNQFGPNSLIKFNTGAGAVNGKLQLRGTNQTVAGLESGLSNRLAMIQNDEIGSPGYVADPGTCTLTLDTATDHSFKGFIRNQNGGSISVIKKGVGMQEFVNSPAGANYSYNGSTTIEAGTLRINFERANSGFSSNVEIQNPSVFNLHSAIDGYDFNTVISGSGKVLVTGGMPVALTKGANSWTGGTTVDGGFLALKSTDANGEGNGPGQTCCGGAMTPSNVINLINGGVLSLDNAGALGNSPVEAQYAPSIHVNEGCKIYGGTNTIGFVSNITLDGGNIEVTGGGAVAGFTTNLCLVGTVIVGGVSTVPSTIFTNPAFLPGGATPSANANVSLGSLGVNMQGTTFQVADVTEGPDLTVSSILTNIHAQISTLKKTGPGTMLLSGANTYTGDTTVEGGELSVSGDSIVNTNKVVLDGGKLGVTANETVGTLFYGGVQQLAGTYGSTASGAEFPDNSRFSGTGVLIVKEGPITDPYILWSAAITNPDDRDKTDDPDGDGFTNLDEYLFGTSPIANTGSLTTTETTGAGLIVRWCERESGTYLLQESATMTENPWPTSALTPAPATDQSGKYSLDYVRMEVTVPIDSARKFVRVEASE